jgi:hypothetical protein
MKAIRRTTATIVLTKAPVALAIALALAAAVIAVVPARATLTESRWPTTESLDRGWTHERHEAWLSAAMTGALLRTG